MNQKLIIWIVLGIVVGLGGFYALNSYIYNEKQADFTPGETVAVTGTVLAVNKDQAAYDGPVVITLESADGAAHTIAVPSMGLPMCAAYQSKNIAVDIFLVEPGQKLEARGAIGEDGSIVPCQSADDYLRIPMDALQGYEGEDEDEDVNPANMSLRMKTWTWVSALYNDGRTLKPRNPKVFTITFTPDARFSATTDCNSVSGSYALASGDILIFDQIISTKMYCEGSQENDFTELLQNVNNYHFTSKGELIMELKFDSGTVLFK